MKALSIKQPWAWAIAYAGKTVENRSRRFGYTGPVAIHASLGLDEPGFYPRNQAGHDAAVALDKLGGRSNFWEARQFYIGKPRHPGLALGAVVAVAEMTGCHYSADCRGKCSPWAVDGQWHITLASIRPLAEPVPARGMLGLWTVPEEAERAIRAQLGETDGP